MPLYREFNLGKATVAVWKITETAEELLSRLPAEYIPAALLLRDGQRRTEWLAVRILLERMCGADARIVYDEAGRPVLSGAVGYISVSHTDGYALLAYSLSNPVGVDMEHVDRNVSTAARRFLNESHLNTVSDSWRATYMLASWCACEALFKLVGDVGGTYKKNVIVRPFLLGTQGTMDVSIKGISPTLDCDFEAMYVNDGELFILLVEAK